MRSSSSRSHSPKARFYRSVFLIIIENVVKAFTAHEMFLMYKQCCEGPIDIRDFLLGALAGPPRLLSSVELRDCAGAKKVPDGGLRPRFSSTIFSSVRAFLFFSGPCLFCAGHCEKTHSGERIQLDV